MTYKELAYSAQQHLQASTAASLKRAHIYELLAASFGFNSYASFSVDSVLTVQRRHDAHSDTRSAFVRKRCVELGYPADISAPVSTALMSFLTTRQIGSVRISALVRQLRNWSSFHLQFDHVEEQFDADEDDGLASEWSFTDRSDLAPIMLNGLEAAASKDNALAHFALALINAPDDDNDDADGIGHGDYWYTQAQQGVVLTGVEKEWADEYAEWLTRQEKYEHHLHAAGRLGNRHARFELAARFGDPSFFEQPHQEIGEDPLAVAEIAERLGLEADAKRWLTVAAESGDTDAMLSLICGHDHDDPVRRWTWVHLSRLCGSDPTSDAHYAINEDGSAYDDDVGGPVYVAGTDGIDIYPLSAELDAVAKAAAQELFDKIQDE